MTHLQNMVTVRPEDRLLPQELVTFMPPGDRRSAPVERIGGLGRAILRRILLFLFTVIVLNVAGYISIRNLTPRYTASAEVLVAPGEEQVVDLKAVLAGLSGSSDVIDSEIQVLRSREIARQVVQDLNLDQLPEFNATLVKPGALAAAREWLSGLIAAATQEAETVVGQPFASITGGTNAAGSTPTPATEASDPIDPLSMPVDRFLGQLDVSEKGRSRVITVSFTSTNATIAAKVANAIANAYIAKQLRAKTEATAQAHRWLDDRVSELRQQLQAAEEAVEDYRRRAGIVPLRDTTLLNQQISEASQGLMHAREEQAAAEARLHAMVKVNPNAFLLNRDVDAAKARVATLQAEMARLQKAVDAGSQSDIGLRALQREADADRNLYDRLLARARETNIQSGLQQADATVISRAERPEQPSFPKPAIIMPLFAIASVLLAGLMILGIESLDHGFSTAAQLEVGLGIPVLGAIPFARLRGRRRRMSLRVMPPRSTLAEAIRGVHTSLLMSRRDAPVKSVLITSALSGEGKSSLAVSMASMMAHCGKRVVLVDCDLINASVHLAFGRSRGPGLVELISGRAELSDTVVQDPDSGAYVLTAGGSELTPPDLFASDAMQALMDKLTASFDLIILDSPPVLGVSDARHLCRLVDRTVLAVRWNSTRRTDAQLGLRSLLDSGANVAGAALTMISPKQYQKISPDGIYRRRIVGLQAV